MKILVLYAHPNAPHSEVNEHLRQVYQQLDNCTFVDLYAEYPRFDIDVAVEQQRLLDHDLIVLHHPLYWYSAPAIIKEWQDLVLEYGFAYGPEGDALKGKFIISVISAGGPEEAYQAEGYNHFGIREFLRPFEQTASLCRMRFIPPLVLFSARKAGKTKALRAHQQKLKQLLLQIQQSPQLIEQLVLLQTANEWMPTTEVKHG